jgi:hypothetical protein
MTHTFDWCFTSILCGDFFVFIERALLFLLHFIIVSFLPAFDTRRYDNTGVFFRACSTTVLHHYSRLSGCTLVPCDGYERDILTCETPLDSPCLLFYCALQVWFAFCAISVLIDSTGCDD